MLMYHEEETKVQSKLKYSSDCIENSAPIKNYWHWGEEEGSAYLKWLLN